MAHSMAFATSGDFSLKTKESIPIPAALPKSHPIEVASLLALNPNSLFF